ncbi:D-lactate dehydrogenase [compost metagenome]
MKTAVFSTHKFEQPYLLKASKSHEWVFIKDSLNHDTALLAKGCLAVCLFVTDHADALTLQKLVAFGVRYITLRSTGYDNVDLEVAGELGLKVARVTAYSPSAIAEHTIALMLALNRKLMHAYVQSRQFNFSLDSLVGFDMKTQTVGIIGTGKIGSQVASILHGFGCCILAYDLNEDESLKQKTGINYVSLENLLAKSDIITLHVPLTPQSTYLIRNDTIKLMKEGVMLINTGRGRLVNTLDVIAALESGRIGYAGIDVYEHEKGLFFEDHSKEPLHDKILAKLMAFGNVIVTGHQAFLTTNALENIATATVHNLDCFAASLPSENILV